MKAPGEAKAAERPLLERFTDALARIIHDERPDALSQPVTVAELYQDIAPYRRMRQLAGIELHADYEHALIRLLGGEGGIARLDPETAAEALMIEAESIDPDLSAYRKYAASEVRLTLGDPPPPRPVAPVPPPAPLLDRSSPPPPEPDPEPEADPEPITASRAARATPVEALRGEPDASAVRCGYCGHSLPAHRDIRYCPFCGGDQTARACAECAEPLENEWRFCVACGAAAGP